MSPMPQKGYIATLIFISIVLVIIVVTSVRRNSNQTVWTNLYCDGQRKRHLLGDERMMPMRREACPVGKNRYP